MTRRIHFPPLIPCRGYPEDTDCQSRIDGARGKLCSDCQYHRKLDRKHNPERTRDDNRNR